ncbi:MAG: CsbD family protein [Deltaproteobacteria bacterium]|nr:CsbD family protein [Deltaproteobacteria bacterium]
MNWDQVSGRWRQLRGKVKVKWGKLTHDKLDVVAGRKDQLIGEVQERYGATRDQAEKQVKKWLRGLGRGG